LGVDLSADVGADAGAAESGVEAHAFVLIGGPARLCYDRFSRLAGVAQLVEQLIRNQQVTRSSRVAGSISFLRCEIEG
jgi:hypothetical protein